MGRVSLVTVDLPADGGTGHDADGAGHPSAASGYVCPLDDLAQAFASLAREIA
jgi:hypothetical protein